MTHHASALEVGLPDRPIRVIIDRISPCVDFGRFAVKRVIGDELSVEAVILADGHDELNAHLLIRHESDKEWRKLPMTLQRHLGNDIWQGSAILDRLGTYTFTVEAWLDSFSTWATGHSKKLSVGSVEPTDILIGQKILTSVANELTDKNQKYLMKRCELLKEQGANSNDFANWLKDRQLATILLSHVCQASLVRSAITSKILVERPQARFSSWYEFFPRSFGAKPGVHGNFASAESMLEYAADLGFDVVYLPPIHPIGYLHRKGKNNSLTAEAEDVGSPWAIGNAHGGHKALHPDLGDFDDFSRFVSKAKSLNLEIALDIAFQCAPDHPYVQEHRDWFTIRPDGTIQYAENPPKKYQDIYPLNFECSTYRQMWQELASIMTFWAGKGVRIFRVDNPHTKSFPFWEWSLAQVRASYPDVIFLSEAFTRPGRMAHLAKLGFSQSYTYFTWRNSKHELMEYMNELTQSDLKEFFRPNFWPNTPDILPETLQVGGRPAFLSRLVLAATLSSNYGIYGPAFELMEHLPAKDPSEEYLHSEKYQLRTWDLKASHSIANVIKRINRIRKQNPAFHYTNNISFHHIDNDQLLAYSKRSPDGKNTVLIVVNLDVHHRQSGTIDFPIHELGIGEHEAYQLHDLISDARYIWRGWKNYVELDPHTMPAHIFLIRKRSDAAGNVELYG